jgi:Family of unknown function (DUF6526)
VSIDHCGIHPRRSTPHRPDPEITMPPNTPAQSATNHTRLVPGFHFVSGTLTLIILGVSLYRLITVLSADSLLGAVIGLVLMLDFYYIRAFPIAVQDRLIRLEERLRLDALLPAELRSRRSDFSADQLIALRFASDAELPALAARVLSENITGRKAIKMLVKSWRADHMRA